MADEQPPVFRLTDQTEYKLTKTSDGVAQLTASFGILEGSAEEFSALAKAAGRAVWALRDDSNDLPSRPLYVPPAVKEAADRKAKRERRSLADVMRDGFAKYLAGEIEPTRPVRAPRRAPGEKPVKSVPSVSLRVSDEEWAPIEERCKSDKARLKFLVNPSRVITQYLREDYLAGETFQE
ncbi:hypothetical protein ABZ605_27660 [Streptomyces sp. NPDC012765]|uniref:hypothetical protein n=1 Tax=Streptomyces sp. NPDC012765 TaxID=3155249 RepID=UPI003403AE26